ncbi:hypothetical protein EXU34_00350 [Alteromonas sp. ZYF713]|nr:hypothetical protein [Alteromonas sp. ZYF713]
MEFKQSNRQGFFNRLYVHFFLYAVPQLSGVALVVTLSESAIASLCQSAVLLIGFNLAFALWLLLFNTGSGRVESFSIVIYQEHLTINEFGRKRTIEREHFGGCKIDSGYPKQVRLGNHNGRDIHFSYYALSSAQRAQLFKELGCDC